MIRFWLLLTYFSIIHANPNYQVILAINCGGHQIKTDLIHYIKDSYFDDSSKAIQKKSIPKYIKNKDQKTLMTTERTSNSSFSYFLPIEKQGKYTIALKFMEGNSEQIGFRVFNIKIGEDYFATIDISKQVGSKKTLTKFLEFELKNDIIYKNQAEIDMMDQNKAVLNGFDFIKKQILLTFQQIIGQPKVQTIVVVKGNIQKFKQVYEDIQIKKLPQNKQSLCEKIYNTAQKVERRIININNHLQNQENIDYYLEKILSLEGFLSLVLFIFLCFQNKILNQMNGVKNELDQKYFKYEKYSSNKNDKNL